MQTTPIKPVEEIEKGLFHTPFWLAPSRTVFEERSTRFKELAQSEKSEWGLYLHLLATLCEIQQTILTQATITLPTLYQGQTVLPDATQGKIPTEFFTIFMDLLAQTEGKVTTTVANEIIKLKALNQNEAEDLAQRILTNQAHATERSREIWVQAALQIIWTSWAYQLTENHVAITEKRTHCPCCGTEAVGSVVLISSELTGLRYMHCPMCNSRWNALRAKCPTCDQAGGINIQRIDANTSPTELSPAYAAAHAESCESCHTYRKLYRQDKQQYTDPIADDLATLGLDIAVGETNYERGGANPFLLLSE